MAHTDEFGSTFTATILVEVDARRTTALDLTGATVTFLFRRPDGVVLEKAATVRNARRGVAVYTAEAGFLDTPGGWEWQPKIVRSGLQLWGPREHFLVADHLTPTS